MNRTELLAQLKAHNINTEHPMFDSMSETTMISILRATVRIQFVVTHGFDRKAAHLMAYDEGFSVCPECRTRLEA